MTLKLHLHCSPQFEAQRPIDTLTHKHRLYFSHFGVTNSTGGAYSTTANFSFLPIEDLSEGDRDSSSSQASRAKSKDRHEADGSESRPAVLRNLPHHLAGRVREEHCTSSVTIDEPDSSRGRNAQPGSSRGSGTATPIANPAAPVDAIHHPLDAYDWAGPVSSYVPSPSNSQSRSRPDVTRAQKGRRKISKPTYRMQLDPLDSFETWILTLAVRVSSSAPLPSRSKNAFDRFGENHRISFETSSDGPSQAASIGPAGLEMSRAMRWERRVAEGLDRVYRDWFHRPEAGEVPIPSRRSKGKGTGAGDAGQNMASSVTPELISTFGAVNQALGLDREDTHDDHEGDTDAYPLPTPTPRRRLLEFDNSSCVLHLQPHACSSPQLLNLHPTLAYFYNPPAAEAAPSSSYPPGSSSAVPLLNPSSSAPSSSSGTGTGASSGAGAGASMGTFSGYQYDSTSRYHALHSRLQASHRVELTWHAESIEVNAGRLLSVLEDVETERLNWERRNGAHGKEQERDAWGRVYKRESVGKSSAAAAGADVAGGGAGETILAGVDGSRQRWRGLEDEELGVEVESRGTIPLWFGNGTVGTYFTGG